MEINKYLKTEKDLQEGLGKEKLESIKNEIAEIMGKNNLHASPYVMQDVLDYVRLNILISKL